MHSDQKELIPQTEEGITKIKWIKEDKLDKVYANTYPSIIDVLDAERASQNITVETKASHTNMNFE